MLINCKYDSAKLTPNTNRHNFANNNLKYNKLKTSTLNMHDTNRLFFLCCEKEKEPTNRKAKNQIMYKLCISKYCEILSKKIS